MPLFSRNPEKYEARALEYERRGKAAKATKNREKAARLRLKSGTSLSTPMTSANAIGTIPATVYPATTLVTTTTAPVIGTGLATQGALGQPMGGFATTRTPAMYEQQALKWEQRGNWNKAQKNREKVWRLQNPNYGPNVTAPSFYNNNSFLGYNVPLNPVQAGGMATGMPFQRQSYFGQTNRSPQVYEARAMEYERLGNMKKAMRYRQKAAAIQGGGGVYQTPRTPAMYEQRALKWEQRGNWQKAQKNREKVWRLQNPQYMSTNYSAPMFYNNNTTFLGYNIPFQPTLLKQPMMGQQMMGQQMVGQQMMGQQMMGAPIVHQTTIAPTVETHVHATQVQQTTRMEKVVEVQPVIHREIDAPQVRIIEQHSYESVPRTGPASVTKPAIVEETVRPRIIEEIQPVVHREVPQTFVEQVQQHVTERVVLPTTQSREVVNFASLSLNPNPTYTSFGRYSQFGQNKRNIQLMEEKALAYERAGNQRKAMRLREKIGRIQSSGGAYSSARTPAIYEQKALKWEQRGNLAKAQRNREKAWRLQNPQYMDFNSHPAPSFYNQTGQFQGYNLPIPTPGQQQMPFRVGQQGLGQQGLGLGQQGLGQQGLGQLGSSLYRPHQYSQFGLKQRDPALYLNRAQQYQQRGNTKKAQKLNEKAARIRANNGAYTSSRTPAIYEQQARKWEQRGNFAKAQKNREKAWRLQNPQYMNQSNFPAPLFYNNNKFSGYNIPYNPQQLLGQGGAGQQMLGQGGAGQQMLGQQGLGQQLGQQMLGQGGAGQQMLGQQGLGQLGSSLYRPNQYSQFGLQQRNPALYLNKAAEYRQRGNTRKADKLTAKANQIKANGGAYRSNRTPSMYENKAQKWEQRGNFAKAQKNREKAWRLNNPQYMNQSNFPAPLFYNNNKFSGYNIPYNPQQLLGQGGAGQQMLGQQGLGQQILGQAGAGQQMLGQHGLGQQAQIPGAHASGSLNTRI